MATDPTTNWRPDWAVHPGEVLAEALEDRSMSQAELARRMDRPLKTINEIVKGKSAITHDTAIQLELVLGIAARLWNNLQRDFWESEARIGEHKRLEREASWLMHFPLKEMVRRNWLPPSASEPEALGNLLRFFAVTSPTAWERQWATSEAAFRKSPAFVTSPHAISAWLRQGELRAMRIECQPFSLAKLRSELASIRELTTLDPLAFLPRLTQTLAECGIAFVVVRELPGTHISGATRWLTQQKALVQLSLRHGTDDQFWFALFHELGHLIASGARSAFLDTLDPRTIRTPDEIGADRFAADQLIPPLAFERIRTSGRFGATDVGTFATELGIAAGIIVGRLEREKLIGPGKLNFLKRHWKWAD